MKKFNSKGFGTVEVLLVVVIVGLIGGVGYYVYGSQKKANTALDNAINSQADPQKAENKEKTEGQTPNETANWLKFSPNSKVYTIKLPDGWVMMHQNDDCDCLLTQSLVYKPGTLATVGTTQGGRDGLSGFFIAVDNDDKSSQRFSEWQKTGTLKIGSLEATKYYYEQTTESQGIGLDKGGKEYAYYIPKGGKFIYISYSVLSSQENQLGLVEKAVQTLE